MTDTCRCCLSHTLDLVDIFDNDDELDVAGALKDICCIDVCKEDDNEQLPHVICGSCLNALRISHNFRVKTLLSDKTLHNLLDGNIAVINDDVDEPVVGVDDCYQSSVDSLAAGSEDSLTCMHCSKRFIHRRNLKIHKQRHFMLGKYGCQSCSQRFHLKYDLLRHTFTIHLGEKPYKCDECEKGFPTRPELNRHQRLLHNPVKCFSCSKCEMQFKLKANAMQHIYLVHDGERNHICEACGKGFAFPSKLRVHQKTSKCGERADNNLEEDCKIP